MNKIITIFSLFCTFLTFTASVYAQPRFKYDIQKASDNVYVLKPAISDYRWVTSNIIFIINDDDVFVVDSGLLPSAADEAIKEIKKITDKPVRYLFNTHWHGDHWQGNFAFLQAYPGIQIITTSENLKMINRNGMVWAKQLYNRYLDFYVDKYSEAIESKKLDDKELSESEVKELQAALEQVKNDNDEMSSFTPIAPSVTFSDKMVIHDGGREIQLLYLGIGNTPGDGIVYLPNEKILITGDLVVYPSPYESGMFSPEWLETSRKLAKFDYNLLIPGHGDVQSDHQYLDYLNALFSEIIKEVSDAYVSGTSRSSDIKNVVTYESVVTELNKNHDYVKYTDKLDPGFVSSALDTSLRRIIQGKQ